MNKDLKGLLFFGSIFVYLFIVNGLEYTQRILTYFGIFFNGFLFGANITLKFYDTTILEVLFSYIISFTLVGILFSMFNGPRGKLGHLIGKILYFVVSIGVGFLLSLLSNFLFRT